ncbi:Lrp/AsnC family transcriptional regulator [Pseudomaricurvus alkylphenolicus]|uniref:Lrp/AsnC family transcriptional regulator n=1 Tax=Pseudomaricurvus alkylphenolicus TaxID=1306991 RepID=UPI001421343A|nr:Lrp/AsnC family transcriptional regulator [Pseudomaricurvus alkylphenolicus]NIB41383.1 Lrp/AsnC family transcriptional regulator [Pseudomaricurvus alkylphenolicus]
MNNTAQSLDRLDLKILQTLQDNGRMTNKELAEQVNLSASACHQRLQKLQDDGWLMGFMGMVNIERLCAPVQCIATISLGTHAPDAFRFLEKRVEAMPEALEAFTVSGGCDFIVRFACTHMSHYMTLTNSLIQECPEISNVVTHVIMKQSKVFSGYPIKELLSQQPFAK